MDLTSHLEGKMVVNKITPFIEEIRIIEDIAVVNIAYDTKGIMLLKV